MNKLMIVAGISSGLLMAHAAHAGRYYDDDYDGRQRGRQYDQDYGRQIEYARVVSAAPIYREVRVSQPRQECWNEEVTYREPRYSNNVTAGGLIGAIAGGVIGHQFGGGSGKAAATAVGAVVGAGFGANTAAANTPRSYRTGYEQRCRYVPDSYSEQRVEGYDVTYRYNGRLYRTRTPYDPGDRIAVDVDVRPVAY